MARVSKVTGRVVKERKPRLSRAHMLSIDEKYMGPEPMFRDQQPTNLEMGRAFTWYNYVFTSKDFKPKILEWLKSNLKWQDRDIKVIKRCPDYMFNSTLGTIAIMQLNGSQVSEQAPQWAENRLKEMMAIAQNLDEIVEPVKQEKLRQAKPTIQDRIREKVMDLIGEVDEALDDRSINIYEFFKKKQVSAVIAKQVIDRFRREADELQEAYAGTCEQLNEGYSHIPKKQLKSMADWWQQFIEDGERYYSNQKATRVRKPRKRKEKTAQQLTQRVKYQREYAPLKIVSVDPSLIVGSQAAILFNTKYRQLTVLQANDRGGLTIKGTTIDGYSDASWSKRLRKPEDVIKKVLDAGIVAIRKLPDTIKTAAAPVNGRVNENTILLRVIR